MRRHQRERHARLCLAAREVLHVAHFFPGPVLSSVAPVPEAGWECPFLVLPRALFVSKKQR